jgi:hypothetical protein
MPFSFRGHCPDCNHDWDGEEESVSCGLRDYPDIDLRLIWSLFQTTQEPSSASAALGRTRSLAMAVGRFGRFCREACKAGTFFQHPKTYRRYFCPRCVVEVCLPRLLNRRFWLGWVSENAGCISHWPLLFTTCEMVARVLAGARSNDELVAIEPGAIVCPGCGDRMAIGDIHTSPLVCPRCHGRSARRAPGPGGIIMVTPIPAGEDGVRQVIAHLKGLAEKPVGSHLTGALAPPTVEGPAALWDRELDG